MEFLNLLSHLSTVGRFLLELWREFKADKVKK